MKNDKSYGYLRQDDTSHWYLIPKNLVKRFEKLVEAVEGGDDESADEINEKFGEYRLNGGVEELKIPMEDK